MDFMHSKPVILLIFVFAAAAGWFWLRPGTAAYRQPPLGPGPIVALGDSLTAGQGAPAGQGYIDQLARLTGHVIINRGVGGNTIAEAHARLNTDVLALKPSLVIVLLGGNDVLRGHELEPAFLELEGLVREIQARQVRVLLVGLPELVPFSGLSRRYRQIAEKTGVPFVPDVMDGVIGQRTLMSDQIHPNAAGYKIMAERIAPVLKQQLE
jgi:lysophospholipase L1-like esterase